MRMWWAIAALTGIGIVTAAGAVTRTDLAGEDMQQIYGQYAPRGDCKAGPVITIDRSGFSYDVAGKTTHSGKFEFAASFWGNSYDGISLAFFPFVRSDDDFGATTLVVNADEVPGKITVSNDGPPPISAVQRALAKASPFMRCGGAPRLKAPAPAPPPLPPVPLSWALLPKAAGQYGTAYDFLHKGEIADAIRALIGPGRMAALETRLAVTGPVQRQGAIYYTSGNAEHLGGQEQAYVLFDAARKRVQVGLWEGGKLTVYAPPGGRLPTPAPIARLVADSPPEDAVALPGTPWELRPVQGRAPIAFVEAAASQKIKSFSLFCDQGRPILAMLLRRRPESLPVNAVWNFSGWTVAVQMKQGNADGTFWIGDLGTSTLPKDLVSRKGFAYLRLTGDMQGQASLTGAPGIVRTALKGCYRF
jgi:hypothetical protein